MLSIAFTMGPTRHGQFQLIEWLQLFALGSQRFPSSGIRIAYTPTAQNMIWMR